MVKTRSRSYRRRRLKSSPCRKKYICKKLSRCKWAKGKKRSFCRRRKNRSRRSKK